MKVVHVISSLGTGGAEMMLYKLLSSMGCNEGNAEVFSLTDGGPVADKILELGVPVRYLGMRRGTPSLTKAWRLSGWIRDAQPNIVQTWMYHADLLGGIAARLAGSFPVVWGIRHGNLDFAMNKRRTIWTARMCSRISDRVPAKIVCCSNAARDTHIEFGYSSTNMVVIPNGFDLELYKPDSKARAAVRNELGIDENIVLIGHVARFDPQKDHKTFISAARLLNSELPFVHFILCGDGVSAENSELVSWIKSAGLEGNFHLMGRRGDVPRILAAVDIAASSSIGEGFPNVVGEAMACGIPCVVTNVGDAAQLIGSTGKIVQSGDATAMAKAWRGLIDMEVNERLSLGASARRHIRKNYSLEVIASQYDKLYHELAR